MEVRSAIRVWKLRSVLFSDLAAILLTIAMGCVSLICSLWDRAGRTQHLLARQWGRMLLAVSFVRATVRGAEKLDPQGSYVVVSNHASYMDIPALYSALPCRDSLFRQERTVLHPSARLASAPRRTFAGSARATRGRR